MIETFSLTRRPSGIALLLSVFFALGLIACSDDPGDGNFDTINTGTLTVSPTSLNFEQVALGDSIAEMITITNTGEGALTVHSFEILGEQSSVFSLADDTPAALNLEPNEFAEIYVEYAPTQIAPASSELFMRSNDPASEVFSVPLTAAAPEPQIFTPEIVTFARTPEGSEDWRVTEITNIGYAPLEIDSISLDGHSDFSMKFPRALTPEEIEEGLAAAPREDDSDVAPQVLQPGESAMVRVIFLPTSSEFRTAEITIESNDPATPRTKVLISANSDAPCLELESEEINFGQASIDRVARRTVALTNCSSIAELAIGSMEFEDDAGGVFGIVESTLPGGLADGDVAILGPRESVNFVLTYNPIEERLDEGVLKISSNDAARRYAYANVIGQGSLLTCPEAIARARVDGTSRWFTAQEGLIASPLATIEFDGSLSNDPDGTQVTYEWALRDKPLSAQTQLSPSITTESPTLWLPYAGRYVVELTVYDGAGLASCEPSEFFIDVIPGGDIWVESSWNSPVGARTDIDLHYVNLNHADQWNSSPWDVYFANKRPSWNDGSTVSLDIDDTCCGGPENLNHDDAAAGTYAFGAYYYPSTSAGDNPVDVDVRVYLGGSLAQEFYRRMNNRSEFWYIAEVSVPDYGITVVDQLTDGYPSL
ncbi:hypothetical protein DL240_17770 [Lujinxingia litoralis]|uniref:PKD domain-containing protein n=1 Tax=Lujinxingia litoralis TaxID=2211119 RepID=A0A328C5D2_9DELT|nr:choice-of-anchor D domain-containing protein [Lujinxingia litoralis]RAL20230.1 hypothetical protein DL240_17770 [Lujinxingia litoralis]